MEPVSISYGSNETHHCTQAGRDIESKEFESFKDFLKHGTIAEGPKKKSTLKMYLHIIKKFELYLGGRAPTPELAKEFIDNQKKTNSPSSLNVYTAALTFYFSFLGQELMIPRFKTHRGRPTTLSQEEWQTLLETASKPLYDPNYSGYGRFLGLRELCLLCLYCDSGLHPSEVISLKVNDISDQGYLCVTHPGGDSDLLPISSIAFKSIRDYVRYRGNQEPYLFTGEKANTHIAVRTAQGTVEKLFKRAGLPDARARSARHRAIWQLRKVGLSGDEIKAQIRFDA